MNKTKTPRWSTKLLRFLLRKDFLEEIEGDMEEIFIENTQHYSIKKARSLYNREVIKLIRPVLLKKISGTQKLNSYGMLQHNFTLAFRSYMRYKSTFLINLIGLASGLACTLLIYLWVQSELQVNQFHQNGDRLYQVLANNATSTGIMTDRATPGQLAEAMAEELPEVELAITQSWANTYTIAHGETNLKAVGQYVGEDYFKVFSYELIQGDKDNVLAEQSNILISDQLALRLFGSTTDVVGKIIEFQKFRKYQVSGIFKSPPSSSTHQFDFIMTLDEFKELNSWILNWKNNGPLTFVLLKEGTDLASFNEKIKDFVRSHNGEQNITPIAALYSDLYLYGKYENGKSVGGRISNIRLFSIIAFVILGIACINFMNLSTARVSRRNKEVGIKKTVGANRNALVFQFLSESMLITTLSLILALVLVWITLPEFNQITGKTLSLTFSFKLVLILMGTTLLTGLMAGSYPALYLSAIKPIKVLKSQSSTSLNQLWLRKGLVILQFSISIILIVSVIVINNQIQFTQDKNIGYNKDNVLYFEAEGQVELNIETFLEQVRNVPGIMKASSTAHSFVEGGYTGLTYDVSWDGKNPESTVGMEYMRVNYDLIELLGFEIAAGRSFSKAFKSEYNKVIFNETAIKVMGLEDPVGTTVNVWGQDTQIIGVVKDFHFKTFHEEVGPAYFVLKPDDTWLIMTKIEQGKERETLSRLNDLYAEFNPDFTLDYKFLDQDYAAQYQSEQRVSTLSQYFSGIGILISCLGLFGLASFSTERRIKEIGIRKILGSSRMGIIRLVSGEFTKIILIAIVIALPLSYVITYNWLEDFAYRVDLDWWIFGIAGVFALLLAWCTVGFQTLKAATVNPVECIKND